MSRWVARWWPPAARRGAWSAVFLGFFLLAAGCRRPGSDCAEAERAGKLELVAEICAAEFAHGHAPAAGLAALAAAVKLGRSEVAFAQAEALTGTAVEPRALAAVAELYIRTRHPEAGPRLARAYERLAAGGHHAEAAEVARQQGRHGWAQSRYQDGLEALDRSLQSARRAGDGELARKALLGLFTMLLELGDLRGARAALKEAATEIERADAETRLLVSFNRGLLSEAEGHVALARAAFEEVAASPAAKPGSELIWNTHMNLLVLALRADDRAGAERAAAAVEATFATGPFKARASSRIARGLRLAGLERLRARPARAVAALDALAAEKPSPQWSWQISHEKGRALLALGDRAGATTAFEAALVTIEGMRSDQFDDFKSWVLAQRRAPVEALFELAREDGDGVRALALAERVQGRAFVEAFAGNDLPASGVKAAPRRIEWLQRLYPALRASPVLATPLPVRELRARLRDVEALVYFESGDRLHVIEVAAGSARLTTSGTGLPALRTLISRWLGSPGDAELAAALGEALLPSGLPAAGADRPLVIVPSRMLGRVPFAALRSGRGFLVESRPVLTAPSLNALAVLRARGERKNLGQPVILANASLDLPEAEPEARAVAAGLAAFAPRTYLGPEASFARLREAGGARVLHLAVHSGVGATGPWLGLADRRVLAAELLDARLGAELVVLASCASAATPDPGLWGSLAASFLASGSRSVVGSLWSTKDRISRELVERFYREGGAADPLRALARTQRAWIAEARPVADWAAFVLYGTTGARAAAHARGRS